MLTSAPIFFVLPDGSDEVSGGNLYNAGLLAALEHCCDLRSISIGACLAVAPEPGIYLIDSLNLLEAERLLRQRGSGQHFVLLVHHLPSLEPGLAEEAPERALEARALAQFDGFLATSGFTQDLLIERAKSDKIFRLEPPLQADTAPLRSYDASCRALMSCNLIPRKGVLAFLTALESLLQDGSLPLDDSFSLIVVGRHDLQRDYADACRSRVDKSPLLGPIVKLVGAYPHAAMADFYRAANLFVSAASMETFGISLQEARCFGLPILAVRGGNSGNHVQAGTTGEVYSDPESLAQGVLDCARDRAAHAALFARAQAERPAGTETWQEGAQRFAEALQEWFPAD